MISKYSCPQCGQEFELLVPSNVEGIFTIKQACGLLNVPLTVIREWLKKAPEIPKRYIQDRDKRRHRVLYASELRYMQDKRIKEYKPGDKRLTRLTSGIKDIDFDTKYPTIQRDKIKRL